jgi:TetR/AcrR family transcriptional regulator, tetracycline repressor protein
VPYTPYSVKAVAKKRGPRKEADLTPGRITGLALKIADEASVEQVSFRRLARELDVTPMALYTHVGGKTDLLNRMAEVVLGEIEFPADPALGWEERLRRGLESVHAMVERHPAAGALIARPLASLASMRLADRLLGILTEAGFEDEQAAVLLQVITAIILGPIVLRAGYGRFAGQGAGAAAEEWQRYGDFLAGISFEEFPNFLRSVGALMNWGSAAEVERQLSTELLVQGLKALPRGQQ